MDQMQLAFLFTAIHDTYRNQGEADGRHCPLTAEELDSRADIVWRRADRKRSLAAWARARWPRWRPRPSTRIAPADFPSADATAQV